MSIFEAIMIVCFGAAWPMSIIRSYKSKSTKGKSIFFLYIILSGYVFGFVHKMIYSRDIVMVLYILNFCMVFADILLYYRNRKIEKAA